MYDRRRVLDLFEQQKEYTDKRISEGIEKYRKGNAEIIITDKSGCPVPNVSVKAKQKTHEFRFGANLFMLEELETDDKNAKYKKFFADVFNMATLPFYWDTLEPERNNPRYDKDSPKIYRRPAPDLCIEYCEKNGITPKLHCLNYDLFRPSWFTENYLTVTEQKNRLARRMKEIGERYADKIHGIEVINETLCWTPATAYSRRIPKLEHFLAEPDIVEWSFDTAERYFPNNELIINEATGHCFEQFRYDRSPYYMQIERAMLKGARIDCIGMQLHFHTSIQEAPEKAKILLDPFRMYAVLDTYAKLGKPLQITEITIPSGPSNEELDMQAEIIKRLYSIWFSHGSVEAAIYWNLVDGYAHGAQPGDMKHGENQFYGGLLNFDLSEKPAFKLLKDMFNEEWHTEALLTTNSLGTASVKAFCGKYEVEIIYDNKIYKKNIAISQKNTENIIRLFL
jgi:GH35 family endo-1,4-beta-xylanase